MRIAVYHNLPAGGGKRALYELVKRLDKRHEIDLYILSEASEQFLDLRPHVKNTFDYQYRENNRHPFILKVLSSLSFQKRIVRDIERKNYDLVFVHNCKLTQSPYLLRYLKTSSLYYCQEPARIAYEYPIYLKKRSEKDWLGKIMLAGNVNFVKKVDRANARFASCIAVNSYFSLESIYKAYAVYPKVCYLGVDTELFRPIKGIRKENIILSIGPLDYYKGHDFVVDSLKLVNPKNRPALEIVYNRSNPFYEKKIVESAKKGGVELILRTNITDEELVKMYNQAKLVVCAQYMEPFGFTPLEGMACGTPVLGVKEGGIREIVEPNLNGVLVERDERQFASALEKILLDEKFYQALASNTRKTVLEKWSWEKSAKNLEFLMSQMVK